MSEPYTPKLTRRATLQWIAASSLASALPRGTWSASSTSAAALNGTGYGTDPNLKEPIIPWPLLMTAQQLQQTALLADMILPGTSTAPAPSAVGIPDFVNEWVSAPYPDQVKDRATIFAGLEWVDAEAVGRGQQSFLQCDAQIRSGIVDDIASRNPRAPFDSQSGFFQRLRFLTVGAYYTTPEGFQDIGYVGNVPLKAYPPITHEERARLDAALSKLGLSPS